MRCTTGSAARLELVLPAGSLVRAATALRRTRFTTANTFRRGVAPGTGSDGAEPGKPWRSGRKIELNGYRFGRDGYRSESSVPSRTPAHRETGAR